MPILIFISISILIILLVFILIQYNKLIILKRKVEQARSTIDVYCQFRFDLIPTLIKAVKSYKRYEEDIFKDVISLREEYNKTKNLHIGQKLDYKLNSILTTIESYPELNSSVHFLNLQKNLQKTESQLQAARRLYNNDATIYNTKISIFPINIIAKIFGFKSSPLFTLDNK